MSASVAAKASSAKGMKAYVKGKYSKAVDHFTEAIKHEPKKAIHYVNRSFSYYQRCDYYSALKDAKKAVNMNPKRSSMAYRCLGDAYIGMKRYHAAVSAIKKGLKVDPNNIDLIYLLAHAQFYYKVDQQALELDEVEEDDSSDDSEDSSDDSEDSSDDSEVSEDSSDYSEDSDSEDSYSEEDSEDYEDDEEGDIVDDFSVKAALGVLNRMVDDEGLIVKGSELWCVAMDLIADAAKRELFICLADDEGRIAWLKHNNNNITKNKTITENLGRGDGAPKENKDLIVDVAGGRGGAPTEEEKQEPKEESNYEDDDTGFCLIN